MRAIGTSTNVGGTGTNLNPISGMIYLSSFQVFHSHSAISKRSKLRAATGEDVVELQDIIITDEGISAQAEVITPEGSAMRALVMTGDALIIDKPVVSEGGFIAQEVVDVKKASLMFK